MRKILFASALCLSFPLKAAIVEIAGNAGELCPSPQNISKIEQDNSAELKLDLKTLPVVEASGSTLTVRRTCSYELKIDPGEGRRVLGSEVDFAGTYTYEKAGRVFISLGEAILAGDDQTLSHTISGRHLRESGSYDFSDSFEGWSDKGLPCGKPFELTLSFKVTARKTNVATPTQSRLDHLNYRIQTTPCSTPAP
jgi:hypothetical protein